MTLLLIFAAMTVGVLALLLIPLMRAQGPVAVARGAYDLAVYKDQLIEVDRDVERGLLTPAQAEAARVEVQRRMLAVTGVGPETNGGIGRGVRWMVIGFIALATPLISFGLYGALGRPDLPDLPYAERVAEDQRMLGLVDQLAKRMEATPDDPNGWVLLGRSNSLIGRPRQAAEAFRKAIEHGKVDANTLILYGESLTQANEGVVTEPARAAFMDAYRADPTSPGPQYYLGIAASQHGDAKGAVAIWRNLERLSPDDSPWLPELRERIAALVAEIGPEAAAIKPAAPGEAKIGR